VHKSDAGGVRLGLRDPDELVRAWRAMVRDVTARSPGARIEGAVVQEMASRGKEVLIGMKRDPAFGPCIVFGAGGTYAEALDDFSFRIAPLSGREAREMIAETRVAKILAGIRGEPPCDTGALVDALVRVSQIACAHPAIAEIDLNPLFVNERGATIVDARFILDVPAGSAG
jgi:acetyltransferase